MPRVMIHAVQSVIALVEIQIILANVHGLACDAKMQLVDITDRDIVTVMSQWKALTFLDNSTMTDAEASVSSSMQQLHLEGVAPSEPGLRVLDVTGTLLDQPYVAQIWLMAGAVFVWIGTSADKPSLSSLSTAVMTRYSPMPLITSIVGAPEMEEQQIAQRLARRTGKQCFVSCQLPDHLPELFAYVERQILKKLSEEGVIQSTQ